MTMLYAIPGTDTTMPAITAHCLGDCNRLVLGLMLVEGYPSYVCKHVDCAYIHTELAKPTLKTHDGVPVTLRRVRL